jgi:hypothetical protein
LVHYYVVVMMSSLTGCISVAFGARDIIEAVCAVAEGTIAVVRLLFVAVVM